jgi:hypothetical protein
MEQLPCIHDVPCLFQCFGSRILFLVKIHAREWLPTAVRALLCVCRKVAIFTEDAFGHDYPSNGLLIVFDSITASS